MCDLSKQLFTIIEYNDLIKLYEYDCNIVKEMENGLLALSSVVEISNVRSGSRNYKKGSFTNLVSLTLELHNKKRTSFMIEYNQDHYYLIEGITALKLDNINNQSMDLFMKSLKELYFKTNYPDRFK